MTDYKLVPVVPTIEMASAGIEVYGIEGCVDADIPSIWEAMIAAAPAVQGEPVSAQVRYRRPEKGLPSWSAWQPAKVDETKPTYHFDEQGWEVEYRLLYTTPQPSFQLPDFATDPDDSDEAASLWDHGFKRGWNACLETVAKAPQPAEQKPAPDVTQLVEALEQVIKAAPNGGPLWHGSEQIVEARAALAAHREASKQ